MSYENKDLKIIYKRIIQHYEILLKLERINSEYFKSKIYEKKHLCALKIKICFQMFIGYALFGSLLLKVWLKFSEFIGFLPFGKCFPCNRISDTEIIFHAGYFNVIEEKKVKIYDCAIGAFFDQNSLRLVGEGLALSAGVELAYMLFTPGPDEAIEPVILGLAASMLIIISDDVTDWKDLAVVPTFALTIGLLFWLRRKFVE